MKINIIDNNDKYDKFIRLINERKKTVFKYILISFSLCFV